MITFQKIREINDKLPTIDQKGKKYVMVHSRIMGFRELCPEGSIVTDIIHLDDEKVVMKTTVTDEDGRVLATGIASEKFNDSFITKTSAFEVCETSSVGRAFGMMGIGIDQSMASAEEVANAMNQQNEMNQPISETEQRTFMQYCEKRGQDFKDIGKKVGAKSLKSMTKKQYGEALRILMEVENA